MGMYNNLFNVNDSEVKRILEMHKNATRNQYLIVEETPKQNTLAVDYGNLFPQGKYLVKGEIADKIDNEINKINTYRMENYYPEVKVFIESSESKIPNYDREKYPLTGSKTDYSKEKSLPAGKLSELRAKNLSDYLKDNLISGAEVIVKDLGSQGPEWTPPYNNKDPKYQPYQYIKMYSTLANGNPIPFDTPKSKPDICNTTLTSSGTYGNGDKGFIAEEKELDLGDGENTINFLLSAYAVPDMLLIEYNGKKYSTGFIGEDEWLNRLLIGTIIGNYYGNDRPWYFANLKMYQMDLNSANKILQGSIGEWKPDDLKGWANLELTTNFFRSDRNIVPYILNPGQISQPTAGQNYWKTKSAITIQQVKGINTVKMSVVGLIGKTEWSVKIQCGKNLEMIAQLGKPYREK